MKSSKNFRSRSLEHVCLVVMRELKRIELLSDHVLGAVELEYTIRARPFSEVQHEIVARQHAARRVV